MTGLTGEHVDLPIQCQAAGRMQLSHEDDDHLLLRIDPEPGIEEPPQ
jgi:hypothetical protein